MELKDLLTIYSKEEIERAKHRGRAYECLACYFLNGTRKVDELSRVQDHILRKHIIPDRVPYFYRLCLFRCMTKHQIWNHVIAYDRHKMMAQDRHISDHSQWFAVSPTPYQFSDRDYRRLSAEESLKHFLQRQRRTTNLEAATSTPQQGVQLTLPASLGIGTPRMPAAIGDQGLSLGLQSPNPLGMMAQSGPSLAQQQVAPGLTTPAIIASGGASRPLGDFTLTTTPDVNANYMNLSSFGAGALDAYDQATDFLNEPLFQELPDLQTNPEASSSLQQILGNQPSVSSAVQPNSISPPSVSSAFQPNPISQSRASSASQANRKSQQQAYTIGVRKKKSSRASSTDACPNSQSASADQFQKMEGMMLRLNLRENEQGWMEMILQALPP